MRILLIAPPWAPVPPPYYGGIELVVDLLAVGFKTAGHDVTLFTTGDSTCGVSRQWALERAEGNRIGHAVPELFHVMRAYERAADFDIVHDHTVFGPIYAELLPGVPVAATVHSAFDNELRTIYSHIARRARVIAVSASQAGTAGGIPIAKVIHHGIDPAGFRQRYGPGDYLLYLGRMSPDKGAHRAIEVARRAGAPLILAGKMRAREEREYFEAEVEPHLGRRCLARGGGGPGPQARALVRSSRAALPHPLAGAVRAGDARGPRFGHSCAGLRRGRGP